MVGAVERGGNVVAKVTRKEKLKGRNMRIFVRERVDTNESRLFTDGYKGYSGMPRLLTHEVINHSVRYADKDVHTNTIESFWAVFKRGIYGQFHNVSDKYLPYYAAEASYRYNLRKTDSREAFDFTVENVLNLEGLHDA